MRMLTIAMVALAFVGRDGRAGTFSYDVATGLVTFHGGAMSRAQERTPST